MIGFGKIAEGYSNDKIMKQKILFASHIDVLTLSNAFELIGVVDNDLNALERAKVNWGILNTFSDIHAAKESLDNVECLVLATPPENRLEAIKVFSGIKAIICEKPIAENFDKSFEIVNYCSQNNILLQVNLWRRAEKSLIRLSEQKDSEFKLGNLICINCIYGNGLKNNGVHMIDLAAMFVKRFNRVKPIMISNFDEVLPIVNDINASFCLISKDQVPITFHPIPFSRYRENSLTIMGSLGALQILNEGHTIQFFNKTQNRSMSNEHEISWDTPQQIQNDVSYALFNLYENLAEAIHAKSALVSSGKNALYSEYVIDIIKKSLKLDQPIDIEYHAYLE